VHGRAAPQRVHAGRHRGAGKKLRRDGRLRAKYRLAAILGCTVAELECRIGEPELIGWQVFWSIEPPLADRLEFAIAQLSAIVTNLASRQPKTPLQYLPVWHIARPAEPEPVDDEDEDGMAPERVMAVMEGFMA